MIDPAWRWKNYTTAFNWRSPEAKYPTMSIGEIAALPVRELLKPGGTAWVWFTFPMIGVAPNIVQHAWGLRLSAAGGWGKRTKNGKLRMGNGLVIRGALEGFMIAQRGTGAGLRARSTRNLIEVFEDGVEVDGLAGGHSEKPEEVYRLLERLTPGWRRADVYARRDRAPEWESFGDQLGTFPPRARAR